MEVDPSNKGTTGALTGALANNILPRSREMEELLEMRGVVREKVKKKIASRFYKEFVKSAKREQAAESDVPLLQKPTKPDYGMFTVTDYIKGAAGAAGQYLINSDQQLAMLFNLTDKYLQDDWQKHAVNLVELLTQGTPLAPTLSIAKTFYNSKLASIHEQVAHESKDA